MAVKRLESLYKPISEAMDKQAYNEWSIAFNEHVIRAITIRLSYLHEGQEAGDRDLAAEEKKGFAMFAL